MSKTITAITVKNISKEEQRVTATPGASKISVEPGKTFDTTLENAKTLTRMYSSLFKIEGTNVSPVDNREGIKEASDLARIEVLRGVYAAVSTEILPLVLANMESDDVAEKLVGDFNIVFADIDSEDYPAFALMINQEVVVTDGDIKNGAEHLPENVKVGDTVLLPVPAFERPEVKDIEAGKADYITENKTLKDRVKELEAEAGAEVKKTEGVKDVQKPETKEDPKK